MLLRKGSRLTERDLALAAGDEPSAPCRFRRPKVAILATGDELVMPGTTPGHGQIVYSNGYALHALARSEGAETIDLGIAADTLEATTAGIRRARESGADILITTGGASVGDHDLVQQALEDEGIAMAFWKIAMRPGKPMMHGRLGAMGVIGLPGNPVSSYVCAFLFMVPLIRGLSGRTRFTIAAERAVLGRDLGPTTSARIICARHLRARRRHARRPPVPDQDSSHACRSLQRGLPRVARRSRRRPSRHGLRICSAGRLSAACSGPLRLVHRKLSSCGTSIEHIVSVHDLFRVMSRLLPNSASRNRTTINRGTLGEMLTRKQYELLRFIHERLKETGVPPSFDEMKDALDLRSKSGIHRLITALEERGFIRRLPNRARAIEVIKLPESGRARLGGRRGFTPSVIEGNLGKRVRASLPADDGERPVAVPVMGRIAAGTPIEAIQTRSHTISVPPDMLGSGEHFALEVRGDSMIEAGILDGDMALIRKQRQRRHRRHRGGADRRRGSDAEALPPPRRLDRARARQPAYEVRILPPNRVRIQGKLVGLFRKY